MAQIRLQRPKNATPFIQGLLCRALFSRPFIREPLQAHPFGDEARRRILPDQPSRWTRGDRFRLPFHKAFEGETGPLHCRADGFSEFNPTTFVNGQTSLGQNLISNIEAPPLIARKASGSRLRIQYTPVFGCFQGHVIARAMCTTRVYHSGGQNPLNLKEFF